MTGQSFGVSRGASGSIDVTKLGPQLEELHERLAGVIIERLPFDAFVCRYDREDVLFYLDPPYWGSEGYYGEELFSRADFVRLRDVLLAATRPLDPVHQRRRPLDTQHQRRARDSGDVRRMQH